MKVITCLSEVRGLLVERKLSEAETACRDLCQLEPNDAEATHLLGLILYQRGRGEEACGLLRRSIELEPRVARFHLNLAGVLGVLGQDKLALAYSQSAVKADPHSALSHQNLGVALERAGRLEDAVSSYGRAIQIRPNHAPTHSHLGNALKQLGRIDQAVAAHRRGVSIAPQSCTAHLHLAGSLWQQGNQAELVECYDRALQLCPTSPAIRSSLIFAMYHYPACSPEDRLREAISWGRQHATPIPGSIRRHCNDRKPERALRLGFVSPDLIDHPCARNVLPVFRAYDRGAFQVFCYSSSARHDPITHRLKSLVDGWRDIRTLNDDKAAALIREDRIDVLVDLSGHMGETRLPLFARRPAPVQVQMTFPGSTGMRAMDYRITDSHSDPPGLGEQQHVEQLIRLPVALTYDPGDLPPVGPPPILRTAHVTFGCLNRPMKITDGAFAAWSRILHSVPGSRLLLLSGSVDGRNSRLEGMLASHGIRPRQVRLAPRMSRKRFLELFNEIDIALDAFPYNGDATTLDGLWMGVPLVTVIGDSCVSRRGVSHLSSIGLKDLVASNLEGYANIARALAADLPRLTLLRQTMRDRVRSSMLGDGTTYTRHLEAALREVWYRWCRECR